MKLFPTKNLTVQLSKDRETTLNELRRNTKLSDTLVSGHIEKEFIGQVNNSGFKIISSKIGRGAICVFQSELQDSIGVIEIKIHTAFKIMFSILMLLPIVGFGIAVLPNKFENSTGLILPTIIVVLFMRFVLIEFSFRLISKDGLNKLTKITGLKPTE